MTILYRLRAFVRWLFRRDEIEQALDTDLADYIERSAAEKMRAGMTEAEARRAARIELGGVEQTKERVRATLSLGAIETFIADTGYALRTLSRQKTFTAVTVLTLALGIGVNVAIYSLAEQALLRPLPVPEPDRLVNLTDPGPKTVGRMDPELLPYALTSDSGEADTVFSYPMFRDLERAQEPFTGLAAHRLFSPNLSTGEQARSARGALVSGSYFPVLGLKPALGRLLGPGDDGVDGVAESVVLSYSYWQSQFSGDPDVLGRTLFVDDVPLTIVGVAPREFRGTGLSTFVRPVSVFVPISISFFTSAPSELSAAMAVPNHDRRDLYWVHLFARLKPGVTRDAAGVAMNPLYRAILSEVEAPLLLEVDEQQREAFRTRPLVLEPGARGQTSSQILSVVRIGLGLLSTVSGLVLVLCCANVAGLILLRGSTRSGEIAVRASMGATRGRLASLLLIESFVLALPAALMSLPLALLILRGASRLPNLPDPIPLMLEAVSGVSLSVDAALVAIGVAVASALVVGLLPAWDLIQAQPAKALQTFGVRQTIAKGVTRFRAALATGQVALSMVLLAMTVAFAHSLASIARLDPGIDIDSTVMARVLLPTAIDGTGRARIEEALHAIPGVSSVASSYEPFLSAWPHKRFSATVNGMEAEGQPVSVHIVSPSFFRTFGIELLAGREFNETDSERPMLLNANSRRLLIVTQRFAERYGLAPEALIGRTVMAPFPSEVVGVVADVKSGGVTSEMELPVFQPIFGSSGVAYFYVRSARPPEDLMNPMRETLTGVDPTMAITNLRTMEQQFRESVGIERFFAGASTVSAVLATALAALGLYGVLAYSVAQRSREIGLRFALGAPTGHIRGMVLRQVAGMAVVGVVLGAIAAWLLGRAAQSLLFGIEAGDPHVLAAAAAVLTAVMLGAAYIPARRASRVDPMTVLRYE